MAEIVIMDFSGIYKEEQFFEGEKVSWLDGPGNSRNKLLL